MEFPSCEAHIIEYKNVKYCQNSRRSYQQFGLCLKGRLRTIVITKLSVVGGACVNIPRIKPSSLLLGDFA